MDISPEKHNRIKYPTLAAMAAAVALATPISSCAQEAERTAGAPMPPPEKKVEKQKPQRLGGAMAPKKNQDKKQAPQRLGGKVRVIRVRPATEEKEIQELGGDVPQEQPAGTPADQPEELDDQWEGGDLAPIRML